MRSARRSTRSCSSPWPVSRSGPLSPGNCWRRPPPPRSRSPSCSPSVRYYATASGPRVREAMRDGHLGHIATPASGHRLQAGVHWCADSGAFTGAYPGDDKYLAWLSARTAHVARCAFAAAPDVVADGAATLARSLPMLERIRALGYPAALVAQDGLEDLAVPWASFDVLFLGGTTDWKLGPAAADLTAQARDRGVPVHLGRVNSLRRLRYAARIGCRSV